LIGGRGREVSDDALIAAPATEQPPSGKIEQETLAIEPAKIDTPAEHTESIGPAARATPAPHAIDTPLAR
jgi:hypothetical protein